MGVESAKGPKPEMFIVRWVNHIVGVRWYPIYRPRHDNVSTTFGVHHIIITSSWWLSWGHLLNYCFPSRRETVTCWLAIPPHIPIIPLLSSNWPRVLAINVSLLLIAFGRPMSNSRRRRSVVGTSGTMWPSFSSLVIQHVVIIIFDQSRK